ncbi:MAG TPA: ABC transporter ATP-binding protein [Actinomycetota bacterium]|nr:ABC transporter ATP-binding protein [Actinomycetota bacterium]
MGILEVRGVTKSFGGIVANSDITLDVGEWEIVGLIGPNGAGKTTLFNCITGVYGIDSGSIRFRDADVTGMKTHERAALGIGRSFQNLGLVRGQTVLENLVTAQHMTAGYGVLEGIAGSPASFSVERELIRRADRILDFTNLMEHRDEVIDDLPYGVLKNIELGAVLATDPQLLLLDEPSSGLSPTESDELGEILLRLREEIGVTILMIEHHVPLVVRVTDYVYVLNFGTLLTEGKPRDVQKHPEVIAAYLGGEVDLNGAAEDSAVEEPGVEPGDESGYSSPAGLSQYVPLPREARPRAELRTGTASKSKSKRSRKSSKSKSGKR